MTWDHKVCVLTIETSVTVGFRSHHLAIWLSDYLVPAVLALSQISSLAQIKVSTWIVESLFSRQALDSAVEMFTLWPNLARVKPVHRDSWTRTRSRVVDCKRICVRQQTLSLPPLLLVLPFRGKVKVNAVNMKVKVKSRNVNVEVINK